MMPMPPTSSDTAATAASSQRIVLLERSSVPASCSSVTRSSSLTLPAIAAATLGGRPPVVIARVACVAIVKSSGLLVGDAVTLPQQRGDPLATPSLTSPVDAAVTVMSFSLVRLSSRWVVVYGM